MRYVIIGVYVCASRAGCVKFCWSSMKKFCQTCKLPIFSSGRGPKVLAPASIMGASATDAPTIGIRFAALAAAFARLEGNSTQKWVRGKRL